MPLENKSIILNQEDGHSTDIYNEIERGLRYVETRSLGNDLKDTLIKCRKELQKRDKELALDASLAMQYQEKYTALCYNISPRNLAEVLGIRWTPLESNTGTEMMERIDSYIAYYLDVVRADANKTYQCTLDEEIN